MIRHRLINSTRRHAFDSLAGVLAAGLALGVAELVAALTGATSLITAVGNVVVDYTPGVLVKWAIDTFGTADKPILLASIVLVSLGLGAVLGPAARDRRWVAAVAFGGFGLVGAIAGASDPLSSEPRLVPRSRSPASVWPARPPRPALAAIVGWLAVVRLLDAATLEAPAIETATTEAATAEPDTTQADTGEADTTEAAPGPEDAVAGPPGGRLVDRRRFLRFAGAAVGGAALTAVTGPPAPRCGLRRRRAARRDRAADGRGVGPRRLRRRGR